MDAPLPPPTNGAVPDQFVLAIVVIVVIVTVVLVVILSSFVGILPVRTLGIEA